jgi:four helix bundle protein
MAKTLEDLQVYQRACEASDAVFELVQGRDLRQRDRDLWSQLNRASVRVASDISEGFEQKTDRHFASFLYNALGGASEVRTQLRIARRRNYVTEAEQQAVCAKYDEVARMLRGLITHLERENRTNRRRTRTDGPIE